MATVVAENFMPKRFILTSVLGCWMRGAPRGSPSRDSYRTKKNKKL
jgi:hypothetical protein